MQLLPNKKLLVIQPNDPDRVVEVIPHAKKFEHNGAQMVAIPHGVEETIVLRNMGLKTAPAPIMSYYDWPARFKAMSHQMETAGFLTSNRQALCLNAPGTGKSMSAIWSADFLIEMGLVKKVLIVAPLSTLKPVWGSELKQHLPYRSFQILTGDKKRKQRLWEQPLGCHFFIINHDGFTSFCDQMDDVDLVIYDEGTALKTPTSQRFRVFQKWINQHDPWLWILTGTPISQSPVDAWTLARLVKSDQVPRSYTAFRDMVMHKVSTFKWVPRPEALDICKKILQPSIRFSLDECKDLPETNYVGRETELTPAQAKAFKDMEESAVSIFKEGAVVAANAAVMLSKLIQIACGVVYDNSGHPIAVNASHRLDSLTELMDEIGVPKGANAGEKVIIFVPLRGVQDWLHTELVNNMYDVASVHGDVSKSERDIIFDKFQNSDEINVLVAHPKVAAHGLTLTRSRNVIWFAPIYSLEQYEQACARIRRLSTHGHTTIFHLYATPFEKELYRRLQLKRRVLSDFLELVRGVNSD